LDNNNNDIAMVITQMATLTTQS
jgi:hypothetical protein